MTKIEFVLAGPNEWWMIVVDQGSDPVHIDFRNLSVQADDRQITWEDVEPWLRGAINSARNT